MVSLSVWPQVLGDCAVFVVMVERWKRKVGGGWIVGFFFFVVGWWLLIEKWWKRKVVGAWIVFFFSSSSSYCRSLGLWMVGQRWKWLLLLCCDGLVFLFSSFVEVFGFGICWCCCY